MLKHLYTYLLSFLAVFLIILIAENASAQGPPPPPPPPIPVPVDGGIVALLVAGAAYGAKKIHDRKAR